MTNNFERLDGASSSLRDDGHNALRSEFLDTKSILKTDKDVLGGLDKFKGGFIDFDDPFKKAGTDHTKTGWDKFIKWVDGVFGKEETIGDQIKQYCKDTKLNPQEQEQLKKEEELYKKEMDRYEAQYRMMYIGNKFDVPMPDIEHDPRFATMKKLDHLVKDEEESIKKAVEKKMGPLMEDVNKEKDAYEDTFRIHNPLGTGEGFRPHVPGHTLEVYWEQIKKEAESRYQKAENK